MAEDDDWDFEDLGDDGVVDVDLADPAPWEEDTSATADPIPQTSAFATLASNSAIPSTIQQGGGNRLDDEWPSDVSGEWPDSGISPASGQCPAFRIPPYSNAHCGPYSHAHCGIHEAWVDADHMISHANL